MSKWVRGIYNAAANFNMSNALRAASGRLLGGDNEHMRKECDKSDQRVESSQPVESCSCATSCGTRASTSARATSASSSGTATSSASSSSSSGLIRKHKFVDITIDHSNTRAISESVERDYAEYTASISAEGQGAGSWVRVSNESGNIKQANNGTTSNVEHITGIPTGVTV